MNSVNPSVVPLNDGTIAPETRAAGGCHPLPVHGDFSTSTGLCGQTKKAAVSMERLGVRLFGHDDAAPPWEVEHQGEVSLIFMLMNAFWLCTFAVLMLLLRMTPRRP